MKRILCVLLLLSFVTMTFAWDGPFKQLIYIDGDTVRVGDGLLPIEIMGDLIATGAIEIDSTYNSITINDSITVADSFKIGLSHGAYMEVDDQATDEINFMNCKVGIGTTTHLEEDSLNWGNGDLIKRKDGEFQIGLKLSIDRSHVAGDMMNLNNGRTGIDSMFQVASTGNVGINVAADATYDLSVEGSVQINPTVTDQETPSFTIAGDRDSDAAEVNADTLEIKMNSSSNPGSSYWGILSTKRTYQKFVIGGTDSDSQIGFNVAGAGMISILSGANDKLDIANGLWTTADDAITIDPDVDAAAILQLGESGDNDTTVVMGMLGINATDLDHAFTMHDTSFCITDTSVNTQFDTQGEEADTSSIEMLIVDGVPTIAVNDEAGNSHLYLNTDGKLGIGTATPDNKLEVYEDWLKVGDGSNTEYGIWLERNNTAYGKVSTYGGRLALKSSNNYTAAVFNDTDNGIIVKDDNTTEFTDRTEQDSLYTIAEASDFADNGEVAIQTAVAGWGQVMAGDNEEWAHFRFTSAGVVTLIDNSANVANSDSDTDLCIYDAGSGISIKNRLGSTKKVAYEINYYTP